MTWSGAAAPFRLLLIFVIFYSAFAVEDNCNSGELNPLVRILGDSELITVKGQIQSVVLLNKLVDSSLGCKSETSRILEQTKTMEKQEETLSILLRKQKQAVSQIKEFGKEVPELKAIQNQIHNHNVKINTELRRVLDSKLDKMGMTIDALVAQAKRDELTPLELLTLEFIEMNSKKKNPDVFINATLKDTPAECQTLMESSDVQAKLFFNYDGQAFYPNAEQLTWYEARDWCTERGMRLASLKTLDQVEAVDKVVRGRGYAYHEFWSSASDIGQKAGEFFWSDGTSVDKSLWVDKRHEFSEGQESCVSLKANSSALMDFACSNAFYFLCEIPQTLIACLDRDQ